MNIKNKEMYSKLGKSTSIKIAPLLKIIAARPKRYSRMSIPFQITHTKEEAKIEIENLKRKLLFSTNQVKRVSLPNIQIPRILSPKGTSAFLSLERNGNYSKESNIVSPDFNRYTPHYCSLYAKPKFVMAWSKGLLKSSIFDIKPAPSTTQECNRCNSLKKFSLVKPKAFTANNTIILATPIAHSHGQSCTIRLNSQDESSAKI